MKVKIIFPQMHILMIMCAALESISEIKKHLFKSISAGIIKSKLFTKTGR